MIKHVRADHKKRQLRLFQGKKLPSEMVASIQQHKCTFALFILLKLTSNDVFLQNIYIDLLIMNIFQIIHLFMKKKT